MTSPDPVLDLGFARVDLDRERRQGLPEVVYAPGKTPEQIAAIVTGLLRHNTGPVLVTRVKPETAAELAPPVAASVAGAARSPATASGLFSGRSGVRRPRLAGVVMAGSPVRRWGS